MNSVKIAHAIVNVKRMGKWSTLLINLELILFSFLLAVILAERKNWRLVALGMLRNLFSIFSTTYKYTCLYTQHDRLIAITSNHNKSSLHISNMVLAFSFRKFAKLRKKKKKFI